MDISSVQTKLNAAGYSVGTVDGSLGPATYGSIMNYVASKHLGALTNSLGQAAVVDFSKYEINTPLRLAHFFAQGCHETGRWQFFTELGNEAYFHKYDNRADLGNTVPGDGFKYRGRGIFQLTGRANYSTYSQRLGIDIVSSPERVAEPEIAMLTACMFWAAHNLNTLADQDNCLAITKKINGGTNGLAERQAFTNLLKGLLS